MKLRSRMFVAHMGDSEDMYRNLPIYVIPVADHIYISSSYLYIHPHDLTFKLKLT